METGPRAHACPAPRRAAPRREAALALALTLTLLLSSSRRAGHMTCRRRRRTPTFITTAWLSFSKPPQRVGPGPGDPRPGVPQGQPQMSPPGLRTNRNPALRVSETWSSSLTLAARQGLEPLCSVRSKVSRTRVLLLTSLMEALPTAQQELRQSGLRSRASRALEQDGGV